VLISTEISANDISGKHSLLHVQAVSLEHLLMKLVLIQKTTVGRLFFGLALITWSVSLLFMLPHYTFLT
jgi:hypothetical protein